MLEAWKLNALRDSAKSLLPMQARLRALKRRFRPIEAESDKCLLTLRQGLELLDELRAAGANLSGSVLEFGSGWMPIIPMLFHLAGARRVTLTDVERLMDERTIAIARDVILQNSAIVTQHLGLSIDEINVKIKKFEPNYLVPWSSTLTPKDSVDIIVSRAVLEHVPPKSIKLFFDDFQRILKTEGIAAHIIDNSDHWQHKDKSISRVNFLRFEEDDFWWRIACMNIQSYQNRLRHSDYANLFESNGWRILAAHGIPDPKSITDIADLPLSSRFRGRDPHDLAILTSYFLLAKCHCIEQPRTPTKSGGADQL